MRYLKLWLAFAFVIVGSLAVLGYYGLEIWQNKPPIPLSVVAASGAVLMTKADIENGQNVWQSIGGQEIGTVWGHGSYVAPDWTADYLHRESLFLLQLWSQRDYQKDYKGAGVQNQAALQARLKEEIRANTYDPTTESITVSADRALAIDALSRYYAALFGDAADFPSDIARLSDGQMTPPQLREAYAIPARTIKTVERQSEMNAFYFWATWACSTNRPANVANSARVKDEADPVTYTSNWPPESLIGNHLTGSMILWSAVSFILLLASIGVLIWYHAMDQEQELPEPPQSNPFANLVVTPSMRATFKYFWVVTALIVVQVAVGVVTAHYGVEGGAFYGIPLADWLPYAVTRTWHLQIGIFWIATAWLATGLFIGPAVAGREMRFQKEGVNLLFACLLVIVVGSLFGTWYATRQRMSLNANFWFGHQGYEYVDMGRFWQIFLFIGLFLWLGLVVRSIWPAFKEPGANRHLLALFLVASAAIGLFYGAGLMWGQHTNLAMAEYWRWWVVHLWVEGFFEVFATVVIAFLFCRLGLLRVATASRAVLLSCTIFLFGGIIGTMHHLYFTGTPVAIIALGAVFSALEVVPLTLVGFEAAENLKLSRSRPWLRSYRWPIYFFIAVAFWNLIGAGVFGFLINPPVALYFMQGLNTTAVHAHTALFGVYGMLGIGLMLFSLRCSDNRNEWNERTLSFAFWTLNIGLVLMVGLSLLPVGLLQTVASMNHGMWHARSAEFLHTPEMQTLRWLRTIGDTIFSAGILSLAWFVYGLWGGWSLKRDAAEK